VSAEEINRELVEIRRLGRLAKDLDRQLGQLEETAIQMGDPGSGFCLARHVGLVEPLTGAILEQPEVRLYSQQGDTYGAYPDEAGLYGHLGNASRVNPNGILAMPRQEAYLYGRLDGMHNACPDSEQRPLTDAQMMEVNKVLLGQTPERTTEPEPAGTVHHTTRASRDDSGYREVSATESELRAILQDTPLLSKERKVLQRDNKDPDHSDELDMQRQKEDGNGCKSGRDPTSITSAQRYGKRAGNPADAKVGSTQHSPSKRPSKSYGQLPRFRHSAICHSQGPVLTCALRSTSTEDVRRD